MVGPKNIIYQSLLTISLASARDEDLSRNNIRCDTSKMPNFETFNYFGIRPGSSSNIFNDCYDWCKQEQGTSTITDPNVCCQLYQRDSTNVVCTLYAFNYDRPPADDSRPTEPNTSRDLQTDTFYSSWYWGPEADMSPPSSVRRVSQNGQECNEEGIEFDRF